MFKQIKNSLLLIILVNLTACSYSPESLKDIYNDLPSELSDGLKAPLDVTAEQNSMINDYVQQLVKWHRRNKLPEYSQNLARLSRMVRQDNISFDPLYAIVKQVDGIPHFDEATHLSYKMLAVAQSLTKSQIQQLEKSFSDEYRLASLEIKKENYLDEVNKGIQYLFKFLGIRLSSEQKRIVRQESKKLHDIRQDELQADKKWNNQLIALLKQSQNQSTKIPYFDTRFLQLWNSLDHPLSGKAHQLEQQNLLTMTRLMRKLIMSFEPKQKNQLSRQLSSMSRALNELAKE